VQLSATARDQHGNPMPGVAAVTWRSADPARATVSADGRVTGVSAGATTVTATITHEGKTVSGSGAVQVGAVAQPSTATVTATADRTFSPSRVTIAAGGTVTWQFSATHNVTFSGAAPAGGSIANSGGGTSASRQFATPGTYGYECTLHSGMTGTVVVQ
jgi:plastocyanin